MLFATQVVLECGHACLCMACAMVVVTERQSCPICRSPIVQCVRIEPQVIRLQDLGFMI